MDYIDEILETLNQGATSLNTKTLAQVNNMNIELHNADGSLAGKYTLSQFLENVIYTFLSTTKASALASVLGGVSCSRIPNGEDLNSYYEPGKYYIQDTNENPVLNKPSSSTVLFIFVIKFLTNNRYQIAFENTSSAFYIRRISSTGAGSWYKHNGTST